MPAILRHPISGAIAVNTTAGVRVFNSPGDVPAPVWTVDPSFIDPASNKVGTILTLDNGTVEPALAAVEATIGTSAISEPGDTADDFTGPFIASGGARLRICGLADLRRCGTAACEHRKVARTFTPIIRSKPLPSVPRRSA